MSSAILPFSAVVTVCPNRLNIRDMSIRVNLQEIVNYYTIIADDAETRATLTCHHQQPMFAMVLPHSRQEVIEFDSTE